MPVKANAFRVIGITVLFIVFVVLFGRFVHAEKQVITGVWQFRPQKMLMSSNRRTNVSKSAFLCTQIASLRKFAHKGTYIGRKKITCFGGNQLAKDLEK